VFSPVSHRVLLKKHPPHLLRPHHVAAARAKPPCANVMADELQLMVKMAMMTMEKRWEKETRAGPSRLPQQRVFLSVCCRSQSTLFRRSWDNGESRKWHYAAFRMKVVSISKRRINHFQKSWTESRTEVRLRDYGDPWPVRCGQEHAELRD
jgi:hypothetical protein